MKKKLALPSLYLSIFGINFVIAAPIQMEKNNACFPKTTYRSKQFRTNCYQMPPKLKISEKKYVLAKQVYYKNPTINTNKIRLVKITYSYANAVLTTTELPPRQKYPKALSLYREVISIDPHHLQAKNKRDLIESIYKSMGRPIPKN